MAAASTSAAKGSTAAAAALKGNEKVADHEEEDDHGAEVGSGTGRGRKDDGGCVAPPQWDQWPSGRRDHKMVAWGDRLLVIAALTGEGTYGVTGLQIERLDPRAAASVAGVEYLLKMQPEELSALIEDRLDDAPFSAPQMTGSFTVAGGVLRSPNVPVDGDGGQRFGSGSIHLGDLGIAGDYTLAATTVTPAALVDTGSAKVATKLGGTLLAPTREFDVSGLVDAIMVKAYEAEVARLEKLRAEDEARKQAEEAEKARLAAEEAARKSAEEEAARKLAEAAAAKKAADDAAAKEEAARKAKEEEDLRQALEEFNRPMDIGLGN